MDFATALMKMWPNGDEKVAGLRAGIIDAAPEVFAKYGIDSPLVLAHIMAQMSHECGAGHDIVENLSYSASRMTEVWPSRFKSLAAAEQYAHNPRGLANKVYNGRMGNRVDSDDGWNFRGRGASQTTGREGYERVAKQTGLDVVNHPEILIDPKYFLECGVSDFINCGCLPFAKKDDVINVTKKLNGGTIGLADRQQWLKRWKALNVQVPQRIVHAPGTPSVPATPIGSAVPNVVVPTGPVDPVHRDPVPQVTPAPTIPTPTVPAPNWFSWWPLGK